LVAIRMNPANHPIAIAPKVVRSVVTIERRAWVMR
jgi:hypothetical protein